MEDDLCRVSNEFGVEYPTSKRDTLLSSARTYVISSVLKSCFVMDQEFDRLKVDLLGAWGSGLRKNISYDHYLSVVSHLMPIFAALETVLELIGIPSKGTDIAATAVPQLQVVR